MLMLEMQDFDLYIHLIFNENNENQNQIMHTIHFDHDNQIEFFTLDILPFLKINFYQNTIF